MNTQPRKDARQILTRDAAPAAPGAPPAPANASELSTLQSDFRSAVAEMRSRMDTKLQEIEQRAAGSLTLEQVRAEMAPHAEAVAEMQRAITNATRPRSADDVRLETNERSRNAFAHFLRTGDHTRLEQLTIGEDENGNPMSAWQPRMCERATPSSESGPAGGYIVLPDIDRNIRTISEVYSEFGALADNVTIGGTEYIRYLEDGTPTLVWMTREGQEAADADGGTYRPVRIIAHEGQVVPVYPRNLLQDAFFDLNASVARKIALSVAIGSNQAFFSGDGNGQPKGFLNHATAEQTSAKTEVAVDKIGFIKTGSTSAWSASANEEADVFKKVQYFIKPEHKPGARYMMDRVSLSQVALFKDADKRYLWQPSIVAGQPSELFATPILVADEMPTGASGKFPVAYGNPSQFYTVVRRAGFETLVNPYRKSGIVRFETYVRLGGAVSLPEAVKFIKWAS